MKAVIADVPPFFLEWRKRVGSDCRDEMWHGVLHLAPEPNTTHQDLEGSLESYLRRYWTPPRKARVYHQINVASIGGWKSNYRVPDLVLLLPDRFTIDHNTHFEGAPSAVVEIHSPGDESYEKLPFYAEIGVPEVWVVHRDTKVPELYVRKGKRYRKLRAVEGWFRGPETGLEMASGDEAKLVVRVAGDDSTRRVVPDY